VKGDNIITIDRLELGEKVDSPDALNLPVQLGVTLLKDKDGRIALQVPVAGNVKDPHFDFAKVVVGALTGAIKNVASAPFAALPKIDGFTGGRLRTVEFDFGSAELRDGEARKLDALATYLIDRKDLTLGIEGTADRQMDGAVLSGASLADLSPKDDQEAGKASPAVPADQMVDEEALKQLAAKRAEAVHTYLIGQTNLEAARIRLKPVQVNAVPDGEFGLVVFSLSVE
jgi:outer membrane protein OmpA-like peptidoglycan-associated protein